MPQDAAQSALEQTFSDLANARLRDKSPALLDYLVGFQLIKADDDGSRAVGMFGFKIGDDWHYAPSFFLNGEIKGLDSLYSVNSDLFVPLNEDWVNAVVNRRPVTLGHADTRNRRARGVKTPDYNRLRTLPSGITDGSSGMGKISSEKLNPPLHKILEIRKIADAVDVPHAVNALGKVAVEGFLADWNKYPKLANAIEAFYSKMDFEIPEIRKFSAENEGEDITIISNMDQEGADSLTDAQKEQVLKGDVAVVDKRPEMSKSRTYSTQTKQQLTNPSKGGLYDVVWNDGSVHQCIVLPIFMEDGDVFVYDLKDDKFCTTKSKNVWSMREYTMTDFSEKLEEISKSADSVKQWDVVVLASADAGMVTEPFMVRQRNDGTDGCVTLKKGWSPCYRSYTQADFRAKGRPIIGYPSNVSYGGFYPTGGDYEEIVVTEAGNKHITRVKSRLFVNNEHCRAIVLERKPPKETFKPMSSEEEDNKKISVSDFGDHNTIVKVLEKIAFPVKAWRTDSELVINDDYGTHSFSGTAPALGHLIRKHGCAVDDARTIIKLAMRQPTTWLIKRADEDNFMDFPQINDRTEGGVMSSYHQTEVPWENLGKKPSQNNRQFYEYNSPFTAGATDNDSDSQDSHEDPFQVVDKAAKTGQKDVFDAAMLGSLVKSNAPTEYVERFLPTIVAGMDRLGRLMFLLYWHYDEFQERYGKDDLAEFTDNLKSTFESLGDLVIFMRRRTLSGDPEFYGLGLNASMDG